MLFKEGGGEGLTEEVTLRTEGDGGASQPGRTARAKALRWEPAQLVPEAAVWPVRL